MEGLLEASKTFFTEGVIFEAVCERNTKYECDVDQRSFKAYLARWMAATTKVAPWTYDKILPYLQSSDLAAAQSCSGSDDGVTCGTSGGSKAGTECLELASRCLHLRSSRAI